MSVITKKLKNELVAYFTPDDFQIEYILQETEEPNSNIQKLFNDFRLNKYQTLFYMGFLVKEEWFSPSMLYLYQISDLLIRNLSKLPELEFARENVEAILSDDDKRLLKENVPFVVGMEYVDEEWIENIWDKLLAVFKDEIKNYDGKVSTYFAEHNSQINVAGRVFFHLVENNDEEYPFAFMATYSTKAIKSKKAIHTPLKNALVEFKKDQKQLLSLMATVTKASEASLFISNLMESGELFSPLKFTVEEAYTFLREIPMYEEAGIMCRVPNWWKKKSNSIKMSINIGEKTPSKVGLDAILKFSPYLTIDGEKLTKKELEEFLTMSEGLVQYKGKWVEINKEKLKLVLEAFEKVKSMSNSDALTLSEAMKMELSIEKELGDVTEEIEISVTNGKWLSSVKEMLTNPETIHEIKPTSSFRAKLRTYQDSGYQWLYTMTKMGLGACLADDMGLGKTIQMIALLDYVRVNQGGHALLILPASLIGNWQNELDKFAPNLTYQVLHNSINKISEDWQPEKDVFLYITTYTMAVKIDMLKNTTWDFLILDEAQAIKNAGTKQTKTIKTLNSKMRIAMTGTPIENRLGDLWSLFDFLNPGLLGNVKEFTEFTKKLNEDIMGYAKLKKIVAPFILRRLKTDKSIISDLPDKLEIKEYTSLTKKQIALYQKLVNDISKQLEKSEGIQRKGLVLASIIKFKQICNHPDQYLGQDDFKVAYSGKFEQIKEICQTIYEKRERVLVFTQFKEMTEPISELLKGIFQKEGFVLHGGTSIKNRNQMVEKFNGEEYVPYMVLSLKAGGVGLNLTAANHVIHFDRWWNPAVENQATDRAFRIGQTKNVMVHKFVTKGTIEEKIDDMIEQKQKLAGDILASRGESWITELCNDELINMFTLGGDVI